MPALSQYNDICTFNIWETPKRTILFVFQGEIGEPGQKGGRGDKGEQVSV